MLGATALLTVAPHAGATSQTASASLGYDISYPQCGRTSLVSAGFGIVGVNNGHPFSVNPCLASELAWAQTSLSGTASFYMNTSSPGPSSSSWPTSQQSPQACAGANSPACSYDFGWNAARVSFANAVSAETVDGSATPTTAAKSARWWLDVETGNAWESIDSNYGPTAASYAVDQAVLQGSLAYFASIGVSYVGIYCTALQWRAITGVTGSNFATVPVWMPGYATLAQAQAACLTASFTGGRVAMIQYPSNGLDGDYICGLVSAPAAASTDVTGSATYNDQLVVGGNTGAVTYVQTSGAPGINISSSGLVSTGGALSAGSYTAAGTLSDTNGDNGSFTFTLSVGTIVQGTPTTSTVKVPGSAAFTTQLTVSGSDGSPSFVQTSGAPNLVVSATGLVSTSGALAAGTYSMSGTTSDSSGDSGTFAFSLSVGVITQSSPVTATVDTTGSPAFTTQLTVSHNDGSVTFTQTSGSGNLVVSSSGLIATNAPLSVGAYAIRGTTSDAFGDKGTFVLILTVTAPQLVSDLLAPQVTKVVGHAVAGRTVSLLIEGANFYGRPVVTSHAGTSSLVTKDSGSTLTVRVRVRPSSPNGVFIFTVTFAHGQTCRVMYNQR